MTTRVVVYAEGAGELYGALALRRTPGSPLSEVELGAAQILVRRTIALLDSDRGHAVQFEQPLNLPTGRPPRGSDLLNRKNLRGLLSWVGPRRPDLAVLLIDEDGKEARFSSVKSYLDSGWSPPVAVGVAVREFESWLIEDMQTVREVLGITIDEPPQRESMDPGEAKKMLAGWLEKSHQADPDRVVRGRIAERLRLEVLAHSSKSFQRFREELRAALTLIPRSRV